MFTIKRCSLIRGVHYERFHCTSVVFILSVLSGQIVYNPFLDNTDPERD